MSDNDRVQGAKGLSVPGAETGPETAAEMGGGASFSRAAGVAHPVINAGPGPLVFVATEVK